MSIGDEKDFGFWVLISRKRLSVSQKLLGALARIAQSEISRIERGQRPPFKPERERLLKVLENFGQFFPEIKND